MSGQEEPKPRLEGFDVTREGSEWVARSSWASLPGSPWQPIEIRAKTAEDLVEERQRTYDRGLYELREVIAGRGWRN